MQDQDYSFLVIQVAQKVTLYVHILCIYICDQCDTFLVEIEWLSVHIIEEKLRNMKLKWIPHKWVYKSANQPYRAISYTIGAPH